MHQRSINRLVYTLNAARALKLKSIKVPMNKISFILLEIFDRLGVIRSFNTLEITEKHKDKIQVFFKYKYFDENVFIKMVIISKETKRVYLSFVKLLKFKEKHFGCILILSTRSGILTDYDCIKIKQGGEVLLKIIVS